MQVFGCKNFENKVGILIANLGTPDAPTKKALRPYLKEFLSDPRIIEKPRWLWWIILNIIILNVRPKRSARLYQRIWTKEGSPLLVSTIKFTDKLRKKFQDDGKDVEVVFGMRYGSHNIEEALKQLVAKGCRRIVLFNMYPQYSATTTASNCDAVFDSLKKFRWVPSLKVVEPYYNHPEYLEAVTTVINETYQNLNPRPEKLVFSFHGIPIEYVQKGDPYCCQCNVSSKLLVERLGFAEGEIIHTFQSRFGRDPWLQPYTDYTIEDLGKQGVKHIAVACPGFTADCLETLDEIGNEGLESFHEHGGERIDLVPCLNDHDRWVEAAKNIIQEELTNWEKQDSFANLKSFDCSCGLNKCSDPTWRKCGRCSCQN